MSEQPTLKSKLRISPTEDIEVPVFFETTNFMPSSVAHHLSIQPVSGNFLVSFYELDLPVIFGPDAERLEQLKKEGYKAKCVARVTIPETHFVEMAKVFGQVLERLQTKGNDHADTQ